MKYTILSVAALAALMLAPFRAVQAQQAAPEDPIHDELRALRKEMVEATNKSDIDGVIARLDKDVIVTWMNGEVSRKPDAVKAYLERMTKGDKRVVSSFKTDPEVEELTHLYGTTGVAYGNSKDHYVLTDGREFVVPTRWSATMVKKDGKWLIANFHASTNVFDNPVLDIAIRKTALWTGGAAVLVGLLLGVVIARLLRKGPAKAGTPA
jgi:hypothetical protein